MSFKLEDKWVGRFYDFLLQHYGNKPLVAVEVGVYEGENAERMCKVLNFETLYLVDPYFKYEGCQPFAGHNNETWNEICEKCKKTLNIGTNNVGTYNNNRLVFIRDMSTNAAKQFLDASVDFVYIDANHDYEFVRDDLNVWYPKIKQDGWMMGHDWSYEGVIEATTEFANTIKVPTVYKSGTDWFFQKKDSYD